MKLKDFLRQFENQDPEKLIFLRTYVNGELVLIDSLPINEVFINANSIENDLIEFSFKNHFDTNVISIG